jgi:putative ABC transport system permease protein
MRYAVRALRKNPAFTIPAILALALGVGAATAIFSIVDCVLFRPLPYPEPGRLISVAVAFPDGAELVPSTEFLNWRRDNRVLESFAAQGAGGQGSLIGADGATPVTFQKVTVGFLGTLRVKPLLGRDFLPGDEPPGSPNVAILSYSLWQNRYARDRGIVGRSINVDGTLYQVAGVLPPEFRYMPSLAPLDVLLPIQIAPSFFTDRREMRAWHTIGRMKPGVTVEQARAAFGPLLAAARRDTARLMPRFYPGTQLQILPYRDYVARGVRTALLLLLGGVACVLLIACANVANLLLARGAGRRREMAVRAALGATRGRLVRHLLTESLTLALAGGLAGSVVCFATIPAIRSLMAHKLPRVADLTVDLRVLAFALLLSIATGIAFGLMPAFAAARTAVNESLKRGPGRAGSWLVAVELALSLTLLVSAGLLFQSLWRLQHKSIGFDPDHLLVATIPLRGTRISQDPRPPIEQHVAQIPGVVSWAIADGVPPNGGCCGVTLSRPGMPARPVQSRADLAMMRYVSPAYFNALHIALHRGRLLNEHDPDADGGAVVINEALVRHYFADEDPIGQKLLRPARTIVGVVADAKNDGLNAPVAPEILLPLDRIPLDRSSGRVHVALRLAGDPLLVARALQQQLHEIDPLIRANVRTMREEFQEQTAQPRFTTGLFGVFALVALALALVGIYGVIAFTVASRTREIGIRMALGADGARVVRLVIRDAAVPVAAGVVLGIAGSIAAGRYLGSVLYDIKATDPVTYAIVAVLLALIAFAATLLPARKASQVDPAIVLRAE